MSQEKNLIDDAFYIEKTRWGTWRSFDKENKPLIISLHEELCISATRFYLKGCQDGWSDIKTYDGTVGGKL